MKDKNHDYFKGHRKAFDKFTKKPLSWLGKEMSSILKKKGIYTKKALGLTSYLMVKYWTLPL